MYDTSVPDGDSPVRCERCGRPLPEADLLALHRGLDHYGDLTETEREAFEEAYAAETETLRLFRLKAIGALVLLYFGFLVLYAVVT